MEKLIIKKVLITPDVASEYLKHNVHNRPIKNGVVKYYASEMDKGNWRCAAAAAITFDWNGNLQDGQHRLVAIIQSGCSIWMYVVLNANPDDFAVIDTGKTRGASDIFALCDIKNSHNVSAIINRYILLTKGRTIVGKLGSFSNKTGGSKSTISNQEALDIYNQNPEYWQEVFLFAQRMSKSKLLPMAFIGALYAYLHKIKCNDEESVKSFFEGLIGGGTETPIVLLRNKLIEDLAKPVERRMSAFYRQKLIAKAWNYYRRGKTLKILRVNPDEEVDFD